MNEILMFLGSVLVIAWGIALLVGVWRVVDALSYKELPLVDFSGEGLDYRLRVFKYQGRFGGTYQARDGDPQRVEPMFGSKDDVVSHVRRLIKS
jgi:hypothetical protein